MSQSRFRRRVARTALVFLPALGLFGCRDVADAQEAAGLVQVSRFSNAGYGDIAVDEAGVLHALWQDQPAEESRWTVFHSTSRDGTAWSEPVDLSPAEGQVTRVRLAVDGAGRVYAFWKLKARSASLGPELNGASTLSSDNGSLRYRVLHGGTWSEAVAVGRDDNVFGWFPAVDPSGTAHLVWSENSDPAGTAVMVWNDAARTVWSAALDGTGMQSRAVLEDPVRGMYALDGFVDASGPQFVALSGRELLYFDGNSLRTLAADVAASESRDAPALVLAGAEPLVVRYDPAAAAIVAHAPDGGTAARVFPVPEGGALESFQVAAADSRGAVVTIQAKAGATDATDLYLVRHRDGAWSAPVNVTANGDRTSVIGYYDAAGGTIHQVGEWRAAWAAAATGSDGAVNLLLTNRRTSVHTSERATTLGREGFAGGWSYPQVFFTRLTDGGAKVVAGGGDAPTPAAIADRSASAPSTVAPRAPGSSATSATAGLPEGTYACHYVSEYAGPIPTGAAARILPGGRYQAPEGGTGAYELAADGGTVQWFSGPFSADGIEVTRYRTARGTPGLRIVIGDGAGENTLYCEY